MRSSGANLTRSPQPRFVRAAVVVFAFDHMLAVHRVN